MANTQKYLNHLLQETGITPACSEEERIAADDIAQIFRNHGFDPEVQEFTAGPSGKLGEAVMGIMVFLGAILIGVGGAIGFVGFLLCLAAAVLFTLERLGKPTFSRLGGAGLSQNVIAYHKAEGPLASPRNRPVVVVAHYDSPRVDPLAQLPYANYRALLTKAKPIAIFVPVVVAILRVLPIPGALSVLLWLVAIVAALVPLAFAVAAIANMYFMPYTSGAVCNKSSVAAMLGVMDAVAPFKGGEEFPNDVPFEEYFGEQKRLAAEAARAAAAYAEAAETGEEAELAEGEELVEPEGGFEEDAELVDDGLVEDGAALEDEALDDAEFESEPIGDTIEYVEVEYQVEKDPGIVNAEGNVRHGKEVVASLGMLPSDCVLEYEDDAMPQPVYETVVKVEPRIKRATVAAADEFEEPLAFEDEDFELEAGAEDYAAAGAAGGIGAALSNFGASASRLFGKAVEGGKKAVEGFRAKQDAPVAEAELESEEGDLLDSELPEDFEAADEAPIEGEELPAEPVDDEDAGEDIILPGSTEVFTPVTASADDAAGETAGDEEAVAQGEDDVDETAAEAFNDGATVMFDAGAVAAAAAASTAPEAPVQPTENVDTLMSEVNQRAGVVSSVPRTVPDPSLPSMQQANAASRASLFELPDPLSGSSDPFGSQQGAAADQPAAQSPFTVIDGAAPYGQGTFETLAPAAAPTSAAAAPKKKRGLFGRKKKQQQSMSDWLGVDEGFDAKSSGRNIGSWDNFEDGDDWKGGAAVSGDVTEEEAVAAVASMGDDELLGHDIWFVAAGASERANAGVKAFLEEHRSELRGVFLINLESVGAGQVSILATEGDTRTLKADRRIQRIVSKVSTAFHTEYPAVEMPYVSTDAHAAALMSLRSLSIAGLDGPRFACSHTEDDLPHNIEPSNVAMVTEVVTETIRRS